MKTLIDKKIGAIYRYNCDRCGKEISFKENTMFQIYIKQDNRNSKKFCDLCDRCYRSLQRGIRKK